MTEGKQLIHNNVSLNTPLTNMKNFIGNFQTSALIILVQILKEKENALF